MSTAMSSIPNYDSVAHHNRLSRLVQYAATAAVISAHGWAREGPANILRELVPGGSTGDGSAAQYAFLTVVGTVSSNKCFVGPVGSYNKRFNDPLERAKYTFMLEKPVNDPAFSAAWDVALRHLHQIESGACDGHSQHFFVTDRSGNFLRFTKPVFQVKNIDTPPEVDTSRWPVGNANLEALVQTAITHDARAFPLYDVQDRAVAPLEVQRVLPGALVEVSFRMIHYGFTRDGNTIDSMTGEVAQVLILKNAPARPRTLFSRRGPYRPQPTLPAPAAPAALTAAATATQLTTSATTATPLAETVPGVPDAAAATTSLAAQAPGTVAAGASAATAHPLASSAVAPESAATNSPAGAALTAAILLPANTAAPFAAHLNPEQSVHGNHRFVYNDPAHRHLNAPGASNSPMEAGDSSSTPSAIPLWTPPVRPPPPELNPEASPYGTHEFRFADPAHRHLNGPVLRATNIASNSVPVATSPAIDTSAPIQSSAAVLHPEVVDTVAHATNSVPVATSPAIDTSAPIQGSAAVVHPDSVATVADEAAGNREADTAGNSGGEVMEHTVQPVVAVRRDIEQSDVEGSLVGHSDRAPMPLFLSPASSETSGSSDEAVWQRFYVASPQYSTAQDGPHDGWTFIGGEEDLDDDDEVEIGNKRKGAAIDGYRGKGKSRIM